MVIIGIHVHKRKLHFRTAEFLRVFFIFYRNFSGKAKTLKHKRCRVHKPVYRAVIFPGVLCAGTSATIQAWPFIYRSFPDGALGSGRICEDVDGSRIYLWKYAGRWLADLMAGKPLGPLA